MLYDLTIEELRKYLPERDEPADFDDFWKKTLSEAEKIPLNATFEKVDFGLNLFDTYDVTFNGYGGQPIKGWFLIPVGQQGSLSCVVRYIGYGGGRGFPIDWLLFPCAGYATLVMDTRGQGSVWLQGDTPDIPDQGTSAHYPGFMTSGILDPITYYYRRVFVDAMRAVQAAKANEWVNPQRIFLSGGSQGGGISLAVAGLDPGITGIMPDVPFLCHFRRAVTLVDTYPYNEIAFYLKTHREKSDQVFQTLSYFDGMNFAVRAKAPALFSVGLMDTTCPPSTVFAAYNHYAGDKEIRVYEFNLHEGGESYQDLEKLKFLGIHH